MDMAKLVSTWSSCARRQVGAVIVRDRRVITTGYNGAPERIASCAERGYCLRNKNKIKSGTNAEVCFSNHAEQNAIIQAAKLGHSIDGATLYCTHLPCVVCCKMILSAGIVRVVYEEGYPDELSKQIFEESGILVQRYSDL